MGIGAGRGGHKMRMIIRSFEAKDQAAVIALWEEAALIRPWNNPGRDIARKAAMEDDLFLIGEIEGEVMASAMFGYDGHRGWVYYLAVARVFQGKGFGRVLMEAGEKRLAALGCPKLNLQIRHENTRIREFYATLGYREDAVISLGKRLIED